MGLKENMANQEENTHLGGGAIRTSTWDGSCAEKVWVGTIE